MKSDNHCNEEPGLTSELERWFSGYPGKILLEQERLLLQPAISGLFGYYLLQLGPVGLSAEFFRSIRLKSYLRVMSRPPLDESPAGWIVSDAGQLPLASDSIDAVLLQHTLDLCRDPHRVLREVERVLIPEGRVIITSFNPWSLWGGWRLLRRRSRRVPWCGRFIPQYRLHDWLGLLGFNIEQVQPFMFRPPLAQPRLMQKIAFLEDAGARWWPLLSAGYMIVAVKRVSTLTPLRPAWKLPRTLLPGRAIEPTTRSGRD